MKTPIGLQLVVSGYQKGNKEAFNHIYEQSYKYLHTCVIHVVKDEDTAMDMLQETYLEISKSISQLKSSEDFLSWAAMIANRKCFAYLKKQKNIVLVDENSLGEDSEDNKGDYFENIADNEELIPETVLQDREKQRLIKEIIDGLNDMQRLCVICFYYNEQKQEEIAEELGIPVNTVKSHLNRAKAKIKEAVVELDVKKGTRLYSFAPFMALLFREEVQACALKPMSATIASAVGGGSATSASAGVAGGKIGVLAKLKTAWSTAEAAVKAKVAVGVVVSAVAVGGIGAILNEDTNVIEEPSNEKVIENEEEIIHSEILLPTPSKEVIISVKTQVLLDDIIELCKNQQFSQICTLDYSEMIEQIEFNGNSGYMLNISAENGKRMNYHYYNGNSRKLFTEFTGYGACIYGQYIAVGEFINGNPVDILNIIYNIYTNSAPQYTEGMPYFVETVILHLPVGEKKGKENAVFTSYKNLPKVDSNYEEPYQPEYLEGIIELVEEPVFGRYQFVGDIKQVIIHPAGYQDEYIIHLDENGMIDFNRQKIVASNFESGVSYSMCKADGSEGYSFGGDEMIEAWQKMPFAGGGFPERLDKWLDE